MNNNKFRVLVTGFGPYGNTAINPSLAVVKNLQQAGGEAMLDDDENLLEKNDGSSSSSSKISIGIIAREVSCEFDKCIEETCAYIDEFAPDAVIMMGEYPGRSMVTVERVGINYNDSTRYGVKDEAGLAPQGSPVVEGGPAAYFSTLPLRRIVTDLRANGVPADISDAAGTLMCNHLLYGAMHHVTVKAKANNSDDAAPRSVIPVGWIHLPSLPEMAALEDNLGMPSMTAELSTKAVVGIILSIVKDVQAGGGDIDAPVKSRLLV